MPDLLVADFRQSLCRRRLGIRCQLTRFGQGPVEEQRSDWRRAVAAVSERRVAEGRALYTERSPAELYRGARSSERERYARPRGPRKFAPANFWGEPASRLGAQRPLHQPSHAVPESTYLLRTRCGARAGLSRPPRRMDYWIFTFTRSGSTSPSSEKSV